MLYFLMPFLYIKAMPTYEYECKSCKHSFEAFQSMSDAPLSECPKCKKELRRLINGGSGIIFKGSGFYVTDKSNGKTGVVSGAKSKTEKPSDNVCPAAAANGNNAKGDTSPCSGCPKNTTETAAKSA